MEDAVSSAGRPNPPVTSAPICRMMRPVCHRKKVLNIMSSTLTSPPINELIYNDRVLVFILAYNEEGAIEEVVSSVAAALTGADILVIDDGSDDMTRVVARRAGAMVVRCARSLCTQCAYLVQTGWFCACPRAHFRRLVRRAISDRSACTARPRRRHAGGQ